MHESRPEIRRAAAGDAAAGATTLANAFAHDPVMNWLIGPVGNIEDRLGLLFGRSLRTELAKPAHLVDVAAGGGAVALWRDIDGEQEQQRNVLRLLSVAGRTFRWRLPRAMRLLSMLDSAHPTVPHRYLVYIGVHRSRQGAGLGGALLSVMRISVQRPGPGPSQEEPVMQTNARRRCSMLTC